MKTSKLVVYSILIGILAGIVTLLTDTLQASGIISTGGSLTFVSFIAWASYFLWGANPPNALKAWISFIPGIVFAVIIYSSTNLFGSMGLNVSFIALPLGVIVGVILMCLGEKLPIGNNVAAIFLSAGVFFGLMGTNEIGAKGYLVVGIGELLYGAIGLTAGYFTVQISKYVSKK